MHDLDALASQAFDLAERATLEPQPETRVWSEYDGRELDFSIEVLGARFWEAQSKIAELFWRHGKVVVVTSPGCGKTHLASHLAAQLVSVYDPSKTVVTATTWYQVRNILFDAINERYVEGMGKLPGDCDVLQWRVSPGRYVIGLSTKDPVAMHGLHTRPDLSGDPAFSTDSAKPEGGSRLHSEEENSPLYIGGSAGKIAAIVDEATGVDAAIYRALRNIETQDAHILLLTNPHVDGDDSPELLRALEPDSGFVKVKISAIPDPDETIEYDHVFDSIPKTLVRPEWAGDLLRRLGDEDDPEFITKAKARFITSQGPRQVVSRALLEAAQNAKPPEVAKVAGTWVGIDVAAGGDYCVASGWRNGVKRVEHRWRSPDTMATVDLIIALMGRWKAQAEHVAIDSGGLGKPMWQALQRRGYNCRGVDFGMKPPNNGRGGWTELTGQLEFPNNKSLIAWTLRCALQEGWASIPSKYLNSWKQLQWFRFKQEERAGGTVVRVGPSKEDMRAKYGESPDNADADMLAWYRSGGRVPNFGVVG